MLQTIAAMSIGETLAAVLVPLTFLMIPLVAILTSHQRKMALLMRQDVQHHHPNEIAELRRDVQQLKEIVSQQAIQMDDFLSRQARLNAPPPAPAELRDRLGS